jgi:hypothetical protein
MKKIIYFLLAIILIAGSQAIALAQEPPIVLPLCEPHPGQFSAQGDRLYFEVHVEAGKNLIAVFDGPYRSTNSLYIKYNQIPTTEDYEDADEHTQDPAVGIYGTHAGVYYIMVVNEYLYCPYNCYGDYTIAACYQTMADGMTSDLRYPFGSTFNNGYGERRYFEVNVEAGENVIVAFNGPRDSTNSLYIKYNQIPTTTDYEDADEHLQDPAVGVYGTQAGAYYIMVVNEVLYCPYNCYGDYTITASSSTNPLGPGVYLSLNKTSFTTGETLTATTIVTNGSSTSYEVEVKAYAVKPDGGKISLRDEHFTFTLGAYEEITKQILSHTFNGEDEGTYEVVVRLEDPKTGADFWVDRRSFQFTR